MAIFDSKPSNFSDAIDAKLKRKETSDIPSLPDDFRFEELKLSGDFGGSSRLYLLGDRFVVKESLKPVEDRELNLEKIQKIHRNIEICKRYLGDIFLDEKCVLKPDRDLVERMYFIQRRVPKQSISMNPDAWNFVFDDRSRVSLARLIEAVEKMYRETGLMIDLLALDNLFYDPIEHVFYVVDADPLICKLENESELKKEFVVEGTIEGVFKTYDGTRTNNAMEANKEHLDVLRRFLALKTEADAT